MTAARILADYARLSPDLVIQAVESTGRWSDARVFALNSYENRVYQVGMEDGLPLVAKFYRPQRWSDAQLREEHDFTRALAEAELPVIAPLADATGETLFRHGDYRFALFARKGGQGMEAGDLDQLHRIGMLLGRMHAVSRRQAFTARPALTAERYLEQPARQVSTMLPAHLSDRHARAIAALRERIAASGLSACPGLRSQGDCHPGNILWTRDDGPWLLDFDDCQTAPAVQDLWMLLSGERHEQELQLAELLDGYQSFCDFDSRELALIEPLRALRLVHYAGWLAARWSDPAFPAAFPWFGSVSWWQEHVAGLEAQVERMDEPPLRLL
ncbi:MAG: serine/threonine protein kinase [Perlucidibaca sp.]